MNTADGNFTPIFEPKNALIRTPKSHKYARNKYRLFKCLENSYHIYGIDLPLCGYSIRFGYRLILHQTNSTKKLLPMKEKNYRSLLKSVSWRVTGTIDTFIISYLITGKMSLAFSISGVEIVTKITLYYFHERLWNKIKIGKVPETPADYQI